MFGIGGDRQVLSMDWDTRSLRAVQWLIGKGRAKVLKLLTAPIPPDLAVKDSNAMAAFVRSVLLQARIRTQSVIVDIPRDQTVLHTMSLPAVELNDLAGMVQLQIAKELPFPLTDAVVDFAVSDYDDSSTNVDVLVAAVRSEVLEFYKSVCEVAGLKLERMGLRPYANMVAINEMLGAQAMGRVLYVDIGPKLTEIGILRDGVLVFSRAASTQVIEESVEMEVDRAEGPPPEGESSIAGAGSPAALGSSARETIVNGILVEVTRSAEAFRSTDPGARFDHIVVAGSTGLEADLAKVVSRQFRVQARLYDPSPVLDVAKHRGDHLAGLAAVIGLGLGHAEEGRLHFDFLHPKKPLDAAARRRQKLPLFGAVAGLLLLAAASAYLIGIRPKLLAVQNLQVQINKLEEELKIYDEAAILVKAANRWQENQLVWPDELKAITQVMPTAQEGYLKNLKLNRDKGEITFKMVAQHYKVINALENKLNGLTREGDKPDEVKSLFKAGAGRVTTQKKEIKYPSTSVITVKPTRILEVKEKYDKKGRKKKKR